MDNDEKLLELLELYHSGETYEAIGKRTHWNRETIRKRLAKLGADKKRSRQARINRKVNEINEFIQKRGITRLVDLQASYKGLDRGYIGVFCHQHGIKFLEPDQSKS